MADIARHIIFKGYVQGVGFRFTAQRIALRYELAGYVKNLPDGSVEMFAQGHPEDVADCLRDISESFAGRLRDTVVEESAPSTRYQAFEIAF